MKTIAFTGHIDLHPEDSERIKNALFQKLRELKTKYPDFALLTGIAEGGDTLAIEVAEELGIEVKLLIDVLPKKKEEENTQYYERQAKYLVANTQILLALWDGVFYEKKGGTSDVVRMALDAQTGIEIHQLPVPRISNDLPVAYFINQNQLNPFPFSWNIFLCPKKEKLQNPSLKLVLDFFKNQVFWSYFLPLAFILIKLISGYVGHSQLKPKEDFLSILSTTILNFADKNAPNLALIISKLAGIGILICAFSYGFFVAMKGYRQNIKRWWWQLKNNFSILWGQNESLSRDISANSRLVVVAEKEIKFESEPKYKHITLSPSLKLDDLYPEKAKEIFIAEATDTQTIDKALELEHHLDKKTIPNTYIQLYEEANIIYAQQILTKKFLEKCRFYSSIYLCVRDLLLHYSPYKFHWENSLHHCHFSIIGFETLGRTLLLELLKQVHYEPERQIIINVLCENADKTAQEFYATYSVVNEESKIGKYVWGHFTISFCELPKNITDLLHEKSALIENINQQNSSQIFFCLKDLRNTQIAEILLPSLQAQKEKTKAALEVFLYINSTSEIIQTKIEKHFNELIPSVNVVCFTDTPSLAAIKDTKLDELAMSINAIYETRIKNDVDILKYWHEAIEKNKNSSRQAADHLWTKIKILGPALDWNFEKQEEYFEKKPEKLTELGDIEHRRWCAELLLRGHRPITEDINSSQYKEISENWDKPEYENSKKAYIKTFKHIDLVPYAKLYPVEAEKDLTQIKAIPNLLHKLKLL